MRAVFRRITNPCIFSKPEWPITAVLLTPDDRPAAESIPEAIKSPPMNFYPSWIHRIPEMLEALALLADERIDRHRAQTTAPFRSRALRQLARDQPRQADGAAAGSAGTSRLALGTRAAAIDTESN
jgi:hypothetical protein